MITITLGCDLWCVAKQFYHIQQQAARYVLHRYQTLETCVTDMLNDLEYYTLEQRRLKTKVVVGYCIVHNLVQIPKHQLKLSTVNTRGHPETFRDITGKKYMYSTCHVIHHSSPCGILSQMKWFQQQALQTSRLDLLSCSSDHLNATSSLYLSFAHTCIPFICHLHFLLHCVFFFRNLC